MVRKHGPLKTGWSFKRGYTQVTCGGESDHLVRRRMAEEGSHILNVDRHEPRNARSYALRLRSIPKENGVELHVDRELPLVSGEGKIPKLVIDSLKSKVPGHKFVRVSHDKSSAKIEFEKK